MQLLIGAPNSKGYFLRYLQRNADILNYIAGDIMQASYNLQKSRVIITLHLTVTFFLVPAIRKYGALNGLSTETYETLHKYYIKNPYRSSNRKDNVLRQLLNSVS